MEPEWYLEAKNRCPESSLEALEKALKIIEGSNLEDPAVFPTENMIELRWPDLAIYTFSDDRKTIILMYSEEEMSFCSVTKDALIEMQR
jgi:hypothetical protein